MFKIVTAVGLTFLIIGCTWNGEVEEENEVTESITCEDYIRTVLKEEGWSQTNGTIFTSDDDNYLVWNLSSNVFTYMHEDDHVQLFINNGEMFVGVDFENDRYDELNDEYDYDELETLANQIHEDFDAKNCPLRGKEYDIFEEEYQNIYAE